MTQTRRLRAVPWLWSLAMALVVTAPLLLARGFALTHDMVFVPHEPFKSTWLSLDGSVPRAVPSDAVVSVLTDVIPGDLLQKAILVLTLWLAGVGAARLVTRGGVVAACAAATMYVWNAYVFERLAIGQWALVVGYAALPWVAGAALRLRRDTRERSGWCALVVALGAAATSSPTGGVLAGLLAVCLLAGRDVVRTAGVVGVWLAVNLPWVVPSVLYRGGVPGSSTGVSAFAARADTPFGVVGSLVSLGGVWNAQVAPPGRGSVVLGLAALVLALLGLVGVRWARRAAPEIPVARLCLAGAIGLVLALLPAFGSTRGLMVSLDAHVPGVGLLRDSQKWVATLALIEALGLAAVVEAVGGLRGRFGPQAHWWAVALGVLVPIAVLPGLAWGLAGRLRPVEYPADWTAASYVLAQQEAQIASGARHGRAEGGNAVAVLPWSAYREYSWNGDRPALDPAPRFLPGHVVVDDDLVVGDTTVPGEDPTAARIDAVLRRGGDVSAGLRRAGIRLVVVERGTTGLGVHAHLRGVRVFESAGLQIWRLGRAAPGPTGPGTAVQAAIIVGDAMAGLALLAALCGWVLEALDRPRRRYAGRRPRGRPTRSIRR